MARTFSKKAKMKVVGRGKAKAKSSRAEKSFDSPVELDARELRLFKRWQKFLQDKKLWQPSFTTPLKIMIRCESLTALQMNELKDASALIQVFENKTRNISPELSAFIKLNSQYMSMQEQFGMTPKTAQGIRGIGNDKQISLFPDENPFESKAGSK